MGKKGEQEKEKKKEHKISRMEGNLNIKKRKLFNCIPPLGDPDKVNSTPQKGSMTEVLLSCRVMALNIFPLSYL